MAELRKREALAKLKEPVILNYGDDEGEDKFLMGLENKEEEGESYLDIKKKEE